MSSYRLLFNLEISIPVATETSGVIGKIGLDFIKNIGSKIAEVTNEKRSTSYLIQRISVAIQKGNVASILGTIPPSKNLSKIFHLYDKIMYKTILMNKYIYAKRVALEFKFQMILFLDFNYLENI